MSSANESPTVAVADFRSESWVHAKERQLNIVSVRDARARAHRLPVGIVGAR